MKVVFLDRDGVINRYPGDGNYVSKWKEFFFLPRSKEAIGLLCKSGFKVVVISNQAGVGKGLYSKDRLSLITRNMQQGLKPRGAKIHAVYYCTHRSEENCVCRKPKAGLILNAIKRFPLDLERTFFVGDTIRDVFTARKAGCKSILVLSGKEKLSQRNKWEAKPDHVFRDLYEAAEFIIKQG